MMAEYARWWISSWRLWDQRAEDRTFGLRLGLVKRGTSEPYRLDFSETFSARKGGGIKRGQFIHLP
jgi:hypothetical protein